MCQHSLKIVSLTPGAGGALCGSCLSDNMLAAAMRRSGHDVVLVPLYTPITTDEENMSSAPLFYGGLNLLFVLVCELAYQRALFRRKGANGFENLGKFALAARDLYAQLLNGILSLFLCGLYGGKGLFSNRFQPVKHIFKYRSSLMRAGSETVNLHIDPSRS